MVRPSLFLTEAEKFRFEGEHPIPKYFADSVAFYTSQYDVKVGTYDEIVSLYSMYFSQGVVADSDVIHNPHKVNSEYLDRLKVLIRNYDIISPVVKRKIAAFLRRGDFVKIVSRSNYDDNKLAAQVQNYVKLKLEESFNKLSRSVNPESQADSVLMDFNKMAKEFKEMTYAQSITKRNSAILKDIKTALKLQLKFTMMLEDWFISGRCFSYKNIHNGRVVYLPIHPLDIEVIGPSNLSPLSEYAECHVVTYYLTLSELDNMFGDKEAYQSNKKLIEASYGENPYSTEGYEVQAYQNGRIMLHDGSQASIRTDVTNKHPVQHVVWKGKRQVKKVKYWDELGEEACMTVAYDYEFDPDNGDISVEEVWIDALYYSWTLGVSYRNGVSEPFMPKHSILDYGVSEISRNSRSDMEGEPSFYNGVVLGFNYHNVYSDVKAGMPYQKMYNSLMYKIDVLINRMISNLIIIPASIIPKGKDWTMDKFLHYIRAFEVVFADDSTREGREAINAIKSLSLSGYEHVLRLYEITESIKNNYWDQVGTNRQSMGQTMASDLNGVTDIAVKQAAASDAWQLFILDQFFESEINGLVDLVKLTKVDGWDSKVFMSANDEFLLKLDSEELTGLDLQAVASASGEDLYKIQFLQQQSLTFLQNGGRMKDVADVLDANNMEDIKLILKQANEEISEAQRIAEEQKAAVEKYLADKQLEIADKKIAGSIEVAKINAQAKIETSLNTAASFNPTDESGNGLVDGLDIENQYFARREKEAAMAETIRKNAVTEQQNQQKIDMARQKMNQQSSSS
jgi:hypothetical protein